MHNPYIVAIWPCCTAMQPVMLPSCRLYNQLHGHATWPSSPVSQPSSLLYGRTCPLYNRLLWLSLPYNHDAQPLCRGYMAALCGYTTALRLCNQLCGHATRPHSHSPCIRPLVRIRNVCRSVKKFHIKSKKISHKNSVPGIRSKYRNIDPKKFHKKCEKNSLNIFLFRKKVLYL